MDLFVFPEWRPLGDEEGWASRPGSLSSSHSEAPEQVPLSTEPPDPVLLLGSLLPGFGGNGGFQVPGRGSKAVEEDNKTQHMSSQPGGEADA